MIDCILLYDLCILLNVQDLLAIRCTESRACDVHDEQSWEFYGTGIVVPTNVRDWSGCYLLYLPRSCIYFSYLEHLIVWAMKITTIVKSLE